MKTYRRWPRLVGCTALVGLTLILLHLGYGNGTHDHLQSFPSSQVQQPSIQENLLPDSWRKGLTPSQFNAHFKKILEDCNAGSESCPENGYKLILLAWQHFTWTLEGMMQGEDVWCGAMMDAIYKLGYSMIIARPEHLNDAHRRYHKNVHLVIWEAADDCIYNPHCVYADFEDGSSERILVPSPNATHLNMPIWKPFHPSWWNNPVEPLTGPFTLSPEPYELWPPGRNAGKENFYLGYTVEPSCMDTPYVPHEERPRQAYIFGKYLGYFLLKEYTLWDERGGMKGSLDDDFYLDFSQKENVTFLAGSSNMSGCLDRNSKR